MRKVKIGIIGTGVGIRTHFNGFKLVEEAEVIAICGSSLERSKEFADKFNIPIACANYKELCDIEDLDLVCITSPNRFHYDAVKYAISKEKHIVCEKPVSDNIEEVRSLSNSIKAYSKIAVVDHQLRFNPYIQKIKEIINKNILGEIYSVKLDQKGIGFADPNVEWSWSFDGKEGGGVRLAMASHFNDLIQFWFGQRKIINVTGYLNPVTKERKDKSGILRQVDASTLCTAFINFDNELNVIYSINAGSYMGSYFNINIFGTKGEITFSLQDKLNIYYRDNVGNKKIVEIQNVFEDEKANKVSIFSGSFRYFAPLIVEAIQTKNYSLLDNAAKFEDALYNIKLLDDIKRSANCGLGTLVGKGNNKYV